jgi:4-hydroxy-2-oxoheptanedioate aldolase
LVPFPVMKNAMKAKIDAGGTALGYLVTMPAVPMVQALAATGVDFVMIDLEHSPIGIEAATAMIAATRGSEAAPLVRVPGPRSDLVKPALDSGAFGIVFPQIATVAEAKATVEVTRYTPAGRRGYGPTYAALRWGMAPLDYLKAANREILNIVLIESLDGVEALDEILAVDGIDVVAVARGDLSENLGVAGEFDHPRLKEVVARCEQKIFARKNVALGGIAFTQEEGKSMIARGYRFLVLGTDSMLVQRGAAAQVAAIRA